MPSQKEIALMALVAIPLCVVTYALLASPVTALKVARDQSGNPILDENGIPNVIGDDLLGTFMANLIPNLALLVAGALLVFLVYYVIGGAIGWARARKKMHAQQGTAQNPVKR